MARPSQRYDVIVIGAGAAGLTAAFTAAARGASVLVLEKSEWIGGTLAFSGGAGWLPGNRQAVAAGYSDSRGQVKAYLMAVLGNRYDAAMIDTYLDRGPEMLDFLEERTQTVRFTALPAVDYHPELPGGNVRGRSVLPIPFDGRKLGRWLKKLRLPKREMTVFGGMQVEPAEAQDLQYFYRRFSAMRTTARLLSRYGKDRLLHGRGTRMIRGLALAGALLREGLDRGVDYRTGVTVESLLTEGGAVVGVHADLGGGSTQLLARQGVIIATGGFTASREALDQHVPHADTHVIIVPDGNVGEGLSLAHAVGADEGPDNAHDVIYAPGSSRTRGDGTTSTYPHFAFDRCKPGTIIVGPDGRRFADEAESYHTLVEKMQAAQANPAWLIADHRTLRKYGMGLARPAPYPYRHLVAEGYLKQARSIAALAGQIGVPAGNLEATVERVNRFAATGVDEDFHTGGSDYTRNLGDRNHQPNPCLGAIEKGPFYALALYATDCGSTAGLATNEHAQVLRGGAPIPGLYAAGLDMNSIMRGHYPGAGTMIGPAMTFGYIAASHAVGRG